MRQIHKIMMKLLKVVALMGVLGLAVTVHAQSYLHQVFVLNEGWSNWQTGEVMVPPTLGVYDPALQVYEVVDTIEGAGFISHAIVVEGALFVAADGQILKYDADDFSLLASADVVGVRQLAERNGFIYATRGEVDEVGMNLPLDAYVQWFHADDLTWAGELATGEGPAHATEGLAWNGDQLIIGINNAFDWGNEVGLVGIWDAISDTYVEYDLGEEGKNPNRLFVDAGQIITVNNRDYGSTSLSAIDSEGTVQTHVVADATAGCLAAVMHNGELKYQITGEGAVRASMSSDLATSSNWLDEAPAYYGVALNPINGHWYGSVTDYSSFGLVEIRDAEGALLSTFDCGVSPGVICMDVRSVSGLVHIAHDVELRVGTFDVLGRSQSGMRGLSGLFIDAMGTKKVQLER